MIKFIESSLCKNRQHCGVCRQLVNGRRWREFAIRIFVSDAVDFECPNGLPWLTEALSEADKKKFNPIVAPQQRPTVRPPPRAVKRRELSVAEKLFAQRDMLIPLFSADQPLMVSVDKMAAINAGSGCRGCRRRRLLREIMSEYDKLNEDDKTKLQPVLSV